MEACQARLMETETQWKSATGKLNEQLTPLLPLDRLVNREILLDMLPKKADQLSLDAMLLELETMQKEFADLRDKGLPQEVLDGLETLKSMKGLKEMLSTHASKLANIFTSMATQDELGKMDNQLQDLDAKTRSEIEKQAMDLVNQMSQHSEDWQRNLNQLGQNINETYRPWMSELEAAIRAEIDKLKSRGVGVSEKELEKRLAHLRAVLEGLQGSGETGSAAFRCIACDRVLPEAGSWGQIKQKESAGKKPHPKPANNPASLGNRGDGRLRVAMPKGERIYRAGFPMVNPKVRPRDRKLDHSRTFGRNMRPSLTPVDLPSSNGNMRRQKGADAGIDTQEWEFAANGAKKGGGDISAGSADSVNGQGYGPAGFSKARPHTANVPRAVGATQSMPAFGEPWPAAAHPFDQFGSDGGGRPNTSEGTRARPASTVS